MFRVLLLPRLQKGFQLARQLRVFLQLCKQLLKINHGDIKATQGDTGHAQATMVTEVYAHIIDEERKINAQKFETAFYANPDMRLVERQLQPPVERPKPGLDLQQLLTQLQENPELASQLKSLLQAG